jgi:AbrB family looped-hinge helix DNA binding protein
MKRTVIVKVTAAGQLSLPAPVRRRWGTARVAIADEGDQVVVRPVPDDPIKAAFGSLVARGGRTETIRARERQETEAAERRRQRA